MEIRTQFTNRILSIMLTVVMVFGMLPISSLTTYAAENTSIAPAILLWVNGQAVTNSEGVTAEGYTISEPEYGWSYDASTNTLTLNNAVLTNGGGPYGVAIYWQGGDLTIELVGTNTINIDRDYPVFFKADTDDRSLNIKGPGQLNVNGGIYHEYSTGEGRIAIVEGAVVNTTDISGLGDVIISDSTVIADGSGWAGIYSEGDITITNSNVVAKSDKAGGGGTGIQYFGNLTVTDSQVEAIGINNDLSSPQKNFTNSIVTTSTGTTVYGTVTLKEELTIASGETINFETGASLTNADKLTVEPGAIIKVNGIEHNHNTDGETTYSYIDDSNHTKKVFCKDCPVGYATETSEGHSGGEASCMSLAVCEKCEQEYGSKTSHILEYSSNGNTITETCKYNCGHTATAMLEAANTSYTGSYITTGASVTYFDGWAGSKEHSEIVYSNNLNVGDAVAKVTVEGKELITTFKINAADVSGATVTLNPTSGTYDGTEQKPTVSVTWNNMPLTENTDYTLSWDKVGFTNADTYTVTVTGTGNFEGTKNAVFSINPVDIKGAVVTLDQNSFVYDGQPHKPTASVTFNGTPLTEGVDYEVYYLSSDQIMKWNNGEPEKFFGTGKESCDSINAGQYYAVVFGKGNFAENGRFAYAAYTIEKATVTEPTIASKPYSGSAQTADISDTDLYTVEKNNGGTEKGSYDVVLKLKDSANYKWSTTDTSEVTLQFKITQARNAWVTEPSIGGWTYGETPNTPVGEAKFGTVYVLYGGTANDGTAYDSDTPPTKAGSYVARFFVDEAANYEPIGDGVEFIIAKADQAAPTGLTKTDTTYFGKADGKISGLTSAMEFRKEGDSSYTAGFNGTLEYLAAGTYYVRDQGDANHNPSPDAVVTVNAGRKLQIVVPQNQVGYTVTVNKTEMEYEGSYTLKVEIHEGYTATEDFKIIISNWECGQQAGVEETYMNAIADQIIEVWGVADITPPVAEIKVKENKWTSFWNNLTFGLFFKETQDVTITADDAGSGVKSIQYYLSDGELEFDEVKAISDWVDYNGTFKIDPNNHYVVYAKITDNAGNTLYINSDGIVLDNIAPTLEGIENGKTYYGDLTVIKSDEQFYDIKTVTLDGEEIGFAEGTYGLIPADNAEHIVVVEDHAGNKTTYTVTVMKNYTVTYKADGVVVDTLTVGHGKDANLPSVPAKDGYVGKWDSDGKNITGDTTITAVYTAIPVVKPDEVKPEDKTDLEDAKAKLEEELKDGSYTDEDKKNIQDAIDNIDDALEVIGNVEAVEESIVKLPAVDTVKPDDEEAIKAITDAQTAYNALSDYEKSLLDEAAKANLDKLAAALVAYDIVEGDGSSWTEDSDHNITFVVNGLFSKFVGIKVDGKDVDKANYEVKAGSTIITLKASYLDTLAVGEHTITVVYTDGSTDGAFKVHAKANSPATGDNSNMFLWIALLFISGGAVITLTVVDRKKRVATKR